MKPPFSYYGGKQRLARKIVQMMPPHTVYAEPYCGSAAVAFAKGIPNATSTSHYREFLNDKDKRIINFFSVLKDEKLREKLIEKLIFTTHAREFHYEALDICKREISLDFTSDEKILYAWAWYIGINWSFSNKLGGGFGNNVYNQNKASTHAKKAKELLDFKERFNLTSLYCEDALRFIHRADSPQTLFYVDPPYPDTYQGHYSGFTQSDFDDLIAVLRQCKGAVLLSCYANDSVPDGWGSRTFDVTASSLGITGENRNHVSKSTHRDDAKRTECVWFKPASMPMREELQPIAQRNIEMILSGNVREKNHEQTAAA